MPSVKLMLRGVSVDFPFEPYEIQKNYMEKVIECLQNETNAVLESPTGTGKTLSLLCSTLGWLQVKKAQVQAQRQSSIYHGEEQGFVGNILKELQQQVGSQKSNGRAFMGMPTIIYASRTHSQLSQAMNELKATSYSHMRACILGSREQMCIHPDVAQEQNNSTKVQMCRIKVKTRSCHFHNRVERKKDEPFIHQMPIIDIEDIVKLGNQHKFCPYYMSKELHNQADIIFMPYNYLLDPSARKSLGVELANNVVILDEAHNIERICEEAASLQIKSTDITLAIEEVTTVMKSMSEEVPSFDDSPKDFTAEDLCILKQALLDFESALDNVELQNEKDGTTFDGDFIYKLFANAQILETNYMKFVGFIEKIVQFLVTLSDGPFQRRGNGLQLFADLMTVVFSTASYKAKVQKCYKVHILLEEPKKKGKDNWLSKATAKAGCRILNYWCFSPGFGMNMLMDQGIRSLILTSGTLAPLNPLISELQLRVNVRLENPHVISGSQICVKIVPKGPDGKNLNCNYQNRENPAFITSLGFTIFNITRHVPNGLLIFFPSYPLMQKYQEFWQGNGTWSNINNIKPIYVEPRDKNSFQSAMVEYYSKVDDPVYKGAIFMGVCRGKVSEGLDFADGNGRAVLVIGLPYPPMKDPRIVLKKLYLDQCNAENREYLRGDEWYSLEATRAVNQAIGRVIRHRNDYGAILLLDERFDYGKVRQNLSMWLRQHIKVAKNFGEVIKDIRQFFQSAEASLPKPSLKPKVSNTLPAQFDTKINNSNTESQSVFDKLNPNGSVQIHKRNVNEEYNPAKRKKIVLTRPNSNSDASTSVNTDAKEFITMVKKCLEGDTYSIFVKAMGLYRNKGNVEELIQELDTIFRSRPNVRYLLTGLERYIKSDHKEAYNNYVQTML